ncbi:MAG: RNA-guided endonuclease IscB [Candidatus Heimdallarchaeota archaeon]
MSVSVMVLNMRGQPLMPTTPRKARILFKTAKAQVLQRIPFTIQLLSATGENKQEIVLGIDPGYSTSGFSAITAKKELLAAEIQLRGDVKQNLTTRKTYRRSRRTRKLRYRPARFANRTRPKGWLTPSIEHKLQSHLRLIRKFQKLLPISKIIVEVATFDPQKLQNPEIRGTEYQHGELAGYHVKAYLLAKWGYQCAYCGKTGIPLEVEHIIPTSRGGSDRASNLTISCPKCNQKKGNRTAKEFGFPKIQAEAKASLKATPFMNLVRSRLVAELTCEQTYGYLTKYQRLKQGLPKSHANDAFVIAGGAPQSRARVYLVQQRRRNNRQLQKNRKGFKPAIRRQRYSFQPHDLVRHNGHLCHVKGVFNYGQWIRLVTPPGKTINSNINNVKVVKFGKGFQFAWANASPPLTEGVSFLGQQPTKARKNDKISSG